MFPPLSRFLLTQDLQYRIIHSVYTFALVAALLPRMSHMFDFLPKEPAEHVVRKLQKRQSYLAKAPYQQNKLGKKSKRQAINYFITKLCPTTWVAPVVINAHDRWEYDRDRKYVHQVHMQYQEKRKNNPASARNSIGKLIDIRPAALEITPTDAEDHEVDPWKLPPIEDQLDVENEPVPTQTHMFLDPQIQQYRPDFTRIVP